MTVERPPLAQPPTEGWGPIGISLDVDDHDASGGGGGGSGLAFP